jgi:hypothetical protein
MICTKSHIILYSASVLMPSNSKVCHNCPACMKEFNSKLMPLLHSIKELNIVERHVNMGR